MSRDNYIPYTPVRHASTPLLDRSVWYTGRQTTVVPRLTILGRSGNLPLPHLTRTTITTPRKYVAYLQRQKVQAIQIVAPVKDNQAQSIQAEILTTDIEELDTQQEQLELIGQIPARLKKLRRRKMALLLPGHNEELIIATTIKSAVKAGQPLADIYVADDNSSDNTRKQALTMLPAKNVLTVERSGKALAVSKAIKHFDLVEQYEWVHVADADSVFGKDYFKIYKEQLNDKRYVVAVGFVQSMRGNWISTYRALSYSYGQHMVRRLQSLVGMITVFPGPTTSFRTDILHQLDFTTSSLTEDFDLTLQVHRKKLGKIAYIPGAISYTQDPQTLSDFSKQTSRWFRGYFQGIKKYRVGTKLQAIDIGIGYQLFETILYFLQLFVFVPIVVIATGNWLIIPIIVASDFVVMSVIALFSGVLAKRFSIVGALPYFYFLRWVELSIFLVSFVEVVILKKFTSEHKKGWDTEGRRYQLNTQALQDIA